MRVTRRELINGTAAALAAGSHAAAANDRIRVGIIGCGGISVANSNAFMKQPECDIAAICDVDDAQLAKTVERLDKLGRKRPDTTKDFRHILDRKDIDACLICTPDHWHAAITIAACQAGKDVYIEKPLATSIGESQRMRDVARSTNRICQMGTYWRSGENYREAVETVQSGKLGKIRQVRCWAYLDWWTEMGSPADCAVPAGVDYDRWLGPAPQRPFNPNRFHRNWRWFWDYGGGLMTDWGVHLINIALWAMGPEWPKSIIASGGKYVLKDNTETPGTQFAIFEFPSYNLIWEHQLMCGLGPDRREHGVMFTGSEASLLVDASGWEIIPEPKKKASIQAFRRPTAEPPETIRANHARNLFDCMKSRKPTVENLDIGHHVTSVASLGNLALRTRTRVDWDAQRGQATNNGPANALVMRKYRAPWKLG